MHRPVWDTLFLLSAFCCYWCADVIDITSESELVKFFTDSCYLFTYSQVQENATSATTTMALTPTTAATVTATNTAGVSSTTVRRKFLAAAAHSHFADCPDSHNHFCFHGTCRFLILEKTPACVCHPGFIGMRCEHADLLAVVATNQRQQTFATILMLGILGSVLLVLLCTIINCWWRRGRFRQGPLLSCLSRKPNDVIKSGTPCCQVETVV